MLTKLGGGGGGDRIDPFAFMSESIDIKSQQQIKSMSHSPIYKMREHLETNLPLVEVKR